MAPPVDGPPDGPGSGPKSELRQRLIDLWKGHPSSAKYGGDAPRLAYWEQVGGFDRKWAKHEKRWPRPEQADKTRPGERKLSPDQDVEADREIAKMRQPEKSITATLKQVERDNICGGVLRGLEHRIKSEERIKEKISDGMRKEAGSGVADAAEAVWDAVRYTFKFDTDTYVHGHRDVVGRLTSAGYRMVWRQNSWSRNPEYKGVNTRWVTADGGRFELQFHTAESLDAKELRTHRAYERLRTAGVTRPEERQLRAYQRLVSAAVPVPDDVATIADYKERA